LLKFTIVLAGYAAFLPLSACSAQRHASDLPTGKLLSEPGPTFRISESELGSPLTFVTYGDMRFTDPNNKVAANPRVRQYLVKQIAAERPAAILLNGDVPLAGGNPHDYVIYSEETKLWRESRIRVFPALGNHEFSGGDPQQALENWWNAFPEMRNRRWYSVQFGEKLYAVALDSDASLLPGSDQLKWLVRQIEDLPKSIEFVIVSLHHPPLADIQQRFEVDHNPRPNETALRDLLATFEATKRARFVVSAGHIHNYERHELDGVVYLVSGGGGARPYIVERTPDDLFQSNLFPNFHYVKFTLTPYGLHGVMYRVVAPEANELRVEAKDEFEVPLKAK
jgi:hypothetical protein